MGSLIAIACIRKRRRVMSNINVLITMVASINLENPTLVWMAVTCARAFLMEVNLAQGKSNCIIYNHYQGERMSIFWPKGINGVIY